MADLGAGARQRLQSSSATDTEHLIAWSAQQAGVPGSPSPNIQRSAHSQIGPVRTGTPLLVVDQCHICINPMRLKLPRSCDHFRGGQGGTSSDLRVCCLRPPAFNEARRNLST
jgi:hypothetical protein